jgi:hypothetical protein
VTDEDELLQRLRAANPVRAGEAAASPARPDPDELFDAVTSRHPRSRRALVSAALIVVIVAAAGVFGTVYVTQDSPPIANIPSEGIVDCAESDAVFTLDTDARRVPTEYRGGDPLEACRELWRNGTFGDGSENVPELQLCLQQPLQTPIAVPGPEDICTQNGLESPDNTLPSDIAQFEAALAEDRSGKCMREAEMRQRLDDVMVQFGRTDWTVEYSTEHPSTDFTPCATLAIDHLARHITVTFLPLMQPVTTTTLSGATP